MTRLVNTDPAVRENAAWALGEIGPAAKKAVPKLTEMLDHEIEQSIRCVNEVAEGLEGVSLSVHLCHAHFNREHSTKGPYDLVIEGLGRMNVDRFALELATP